MPSRTRKPQPVKRSAFPWRALVIPVAVLLLLVIGSFGFAANMEENDSFCSSCHTQPESTYFSREQAGQKVDLATFHYGEGTKCIDCHSGEGVGGRVSAIMMGSRNALAYMTHTAQQPAPLTVPIGDGNCLKCHQKVLQTEDFNNHFHAFLPRWQARDPNAATCVECHNTHVLGGDEQIGFLTQEHTVPVCQRCHSALGEGE